MNLDSADFQKLDDKSKCVEISKRIDRLDQETDFTLQKLEVIKNTREMLLYELKFHSLAVPAKDPINEKVTELDSVSDPEYPIQI